MLIILPLFPIDFVNVVNNTDFQMLNKTPFVKMFYSFSMSLDSKN